MSLFTDVPVAPPDAILSLATNFKEDKDPRKVNLGIGAYRTEEGKPWPLPSVKQAERLILHARGEDKEYVPIDGKPDYKRPVQELIFSEAEIAKGTIATAQTLSGTGSLQLIGQFLKNFVGCSKIHLPDPTWGNHHAIFKRAGLEVAKFTYYHPPTRGFDFNGMMAALSSIPRGDAVLLHACAQNPTGVDPSPEQWRAIIAVVKERGIVPVLDNAYQGYASGDLAKDGLSQRLFEDSGMEYFISQSFAKNFGLYGERIGYVHVRCADQTIAAAVLSQLKILIRQAYSSPPRHGATIVNTILTNPELKAQWLQELKFMANRIDGMRWALRRAIEVRGTPGTWSHITDQIGMFSYTGLETRQVERMISEFHIYMTKDGRISMAGLNPGNVEYVAECINTVVRQPNGVPAVSYQVARPQTQVVGSQVAGTQIVGSRVVGPPVMVGGTQVVSSSRVLGSHVMGSSQVVVGSQVVGSAEMQQPQRFTVTPQMFERLMRGEEVSEMEIRQRVPVAVDGNVIERDNTGQPAAAVTTAPVAEDNENGGAKKSKESKTVKVSKKKTTKGCC